MIWVILISAIIIFTFILILSRPLRIVCKINVLPDEQFMVISATLWKVNIYQKEWSIINKQSREKSNSTDAITTINNLINLFNESTSHLTKLYNKRNKIKQTFHYMLKNSILHQFSWITTFGTGSASSTGIIAGGLWTTKQTVHKMLHKIEHIDCQPELKVIPDFQWKDFSTQLVCIISIRLVKAILISLIFHGKSQRNFKNN